MRQRFLSDEEISKDLDQQVDEIIQITEGPSDLAKNIGKQNPFKSVEQTLMSAPPAPEVGDPEFRPRRNVDPQGMEIVRATEV